MYIIIIGCGKLGRTLAFELSDVGHNVSVVDSDAEKLAALGSGFNGLSVRGVEYDDGVLRQAGIARADCVVCATADDNLNITAALAARELFGVGRVIARVNDPAKKSAFELLNIETIDPTELVSYLIRSKLEGEKT